MNKKPISQLPDADTLTGQEYIPIVQNGVTKKARTGAYLPAAGLKGQVLSKASNTNNDYSWADRQYKNAVDIREFQDGIAVGVFDPTYRDVTDITPAIIRAFGVLSNDGYSYISGQTPELTRGDTLVLPKGSYKCQPFSYHFPMHLTGSGMSLTRLAPVNNVHVNGSTAEQFITLKRGPSNTPYLSENHIPGSLIENLFIDGRGRTIDIGGLEYQYHHRYLLRNVRIAHFARTALTVNQSPRESVFDYVYLIGSGDGSSYPQFDLSDDTAADDTNNMHFKNFFSIFPFGDSMWLRPDPANSTKSRNVYFSQSMIHGVTLGIRQPMMFQDGYGYIGTPAMRGSTALTIAGNGSVFLNGARFVNSSYGKPSIRECDYPIDSGYSKQTGPSASGEMGVTFYGAVSTTALSTAITKTVPSVPTALSLAITNTRPTASTTLTAEITSTSSTSISVNIASTIEIGSVLLIDSEVMVVTAVSGTTLTVTRGAAGTTAATHLTGALVRTNIVKVSSSTGIGAGSVLLIDSELVTVTSTSGGTNLLVTRGTGGTTATNHLINATVSDTIGVNSSTGITAGSVLLIDSERLAVVSVSGNYLVVTRGVSNTTSAPHSAGATVQGFTPNPYFEERVPRTNLMPTGTRVKVSGQRPYEISGTNYYYLIDSTPPQLASTVANAMANIPITYTSASNLNATITSYVNTGATNYLHYAQGNVGQTQYLTGSVTTSSGSPTLTVVPGSVNSSVDSDESFIFQDSEHNLTTGALIRFTGTLPTGISADVDYYAVVPTTRSFQTYPMPLASLNAGYATTSSSSLTIVSSGDITLTIVNVGTFGPDQMVSVVWDVDNWMMIRVKSYNSATGQVVGSVFASKGSGTYGSPQSTWDITRTTANTGQWGEVATSPTTFKIARSFLDAEYSAKNPSDTSRLVSVSSVGSCTFTTQRHFVSLEKGSLSLQDIDFDGTTDNSLIRAASDVKLDIGQGMDFAQNKALPTNFNTVMQQIPVYLSSDVFPGNNTTAFANGLRAEYPKLLKNAQYTFEGTLYVTSDPVEDIKLAVSYNNLYDLKWYASGLASDGTTFTTSDGIVGEGTGTTASVTMGTKSATVPNVITVKGTFNTLTGAPVFNLRFAQNANSATVNDTAATLRAGSNLMFTQIG
jgi:hypothetical protein